MSAASDDVGSTALLYGTLMYMDSQLEGSLNLLLVSWQAIRRPGACSARPTKNPLQFLVM